MKWKEEFAKPPREYGVYPIIHEKISDAESADSFFEKGFAGVVGSIDYTNDYPDDCAAWDAAEKGFRAYIKRGMKTWIYDEKGYPSGTAGGAVLERHPEYEAIGLNCIPYWKTLNGVADYRADSPDGKLFKALLIPAGGGEEIDITDTADSRGTLRFRIPEGAWRLWFLVERPMYDSTHVIHSYSEPRRYIDLFDADATREFIEVTYEKYAQRLNDEFGKGIKAFFTDEPSLMGWHIPAATYPLLSWSRLFPKYFFERYGYPVHKAVIAVLTDGGHDAIRRRCDFWELTADLIAKNFIRVLSDWCKEHNTVLSGHLIEEEKLVGHIYSYGSYYRSIREMGYPGIDQLTSNPTELMDNSLLPIARLAASAADVYGKGECFTEASAHMQVFKQNLHVPISWAKASVNWHFALGINNVTSYYKIKQYTDEELRDWNNYTARIGLALRQGERYSRVAILYPENAAWAAFTPTAGPRNSGQSELMLKIEQSFIDASWAMINRQIDFDYINEQDLTGGTIENKILRVRERQYECLILPNAFVMEDDSFDTITKFIAAGGTVIALDRLPSISRKTGNEAAGAEGLKKYINFGLYRIENSDFSAVTDVLPRTIRVIGDINALDGTANLERNNKEIISKTLLSHIRVSDDETIIFLCNMGGIDYIGEIELPECNSLLQLHPQSGDVTELKPEKSINIQIPAYNSTVFVLQ